MAYHRLQELMSRMLVVNAPAIFSLFWRLIHIFIDDRVKAKIQFVGSLKTLHEFVDPHILPRHLGGCVDDDRVLSSRDGEQAAFGPGSDSGHAKCLLRKGTLLN
jgi:CRAL/TRIO domain